METLKTSRRFVARAPQFLRYVLYLTLFGFIAREADALYRASARASSYAAKSTAPSSSSELPSNREYVSRIVAAHLFPSVDRPGTVDAPILAAASTEITVQGILYSEDPSLSGAILRINNQDRPYAVGGTLPDGEKIDEIRPDRVIIDRNGTLYSLPLTIQQASYNASFAKISLTDADEDSGDPSGVTLPTTASQPKSGPDTPSAAAMAPIAADPLLSHKFPSLKAIRRERRNRFANIPPDKH